MFRKMMVFLAALLLIFGLSLPASAEETSFVADDAGLLLSGEIAALEEKAKELWDDYGIHAVILTVDSLGGGRAQDYADDYYDGAGYGDDGVLFLLAMAEREWYISTSGNMRYALTDYGIQQVGESMVPYLAEGQWYEGFCLFLDSLPVYLDALANGSPLDGFADYTGDYYHGDQDEILYYEEESAPSLLLSLLCGMVISGIVILVMRFTMNTKRQQRCATAYMIDGSWNLVQHRDMFLYSNVTKTRKQEPSNKSGGGSSVHRSSGGRSHGGGGGKF